MYFPKPSLNENDMAIIERGDTAAHSIEAGQYVSWHGKTGKAKAAILQGATLEDTLFDYSENGAINELNASLTFSTTEQVVGSWIDGRPVYRIVIAYNNETQSEINVSSYNIDIILEAHFYHRNIRNNSYCFGTYYYASDDWFAPYLMEGRGAILLRHGSNYSYGPGYLIMTYVKQAS